jgi:hypothetical protein
VNWVMYCDAATARLWWQCWYTAVRGDRRTEGSLFSRDTRSVYAIVFTCLKVMAAEKMMEELEELVYMAYFDMEMFPVEDLTLDYLPSRLR